MRPLHSVLLVSLFILALSSASPGFTSPVTLFQGNLSITLAQQGAGFDLPGTPFDCSRHAKLVLYFKHTGSDAVLTARYKGAGSTYNAWYYLVSGPAPVVEYDLAGVRAGLQATQVESVRLYCDEPLSSPCHLVLEKAELQDKPVLLPVDETISTVKLDPENAVENPGFELGFQHWSSWGNWDGGRYLFGTLKGKGAYEGRTSATIIAQRRGRGGLFQALHLPLEGPWTFSCMYRGEGSAVFFPWADHGKLSSTPHLPAPSEWTRFKAELVPDSTDRPVYLYLHNTGSGTLYLDSIKVSCPGWTRTPAPLVAGKPPRVEIRGRAFYVNDKPFFPVGLYGCKAPSSELAGTAFNLVEADAVGGASLAELNALARLHKYAWVNLSGLLRAHCYENVKTAITPFLNHPAVFGWYVCDEPDHSHWNVPPPELRTASRLIKQTDPLRRPTLAVVMPWALSNFYQYRDTVDCLMSDEYCIGESTPAPIEKVATTVDRLVAATEGKRPVIAVLQAFGSPRLPTPAEETAMTYLALTRGANGIMWFELQAAKQSPPLWDTLQRLAFELTSLAPDLCSALKPFQPTFKAAGIACKLYETPDRYLLITVNFTPEVWPNVVFNSLPLAKGKVKELFTSTPALEITNGRLELDFAPYQRRVFSFPKTP